MNEVSIRYSVPSKYEVAPYGTICKVIGEHEVQALYVQCSEDLNAPSWKPVGEILEKAFKDYCQNKDFIQLCLRLSFDYEDRRKHYKSISELLSL